MTSMPFCSCARLPAIFLSPLSATTGNACY